MRLWMHHAGLRFLSVMAVVAALATTGIAASESGGAAASRVSPAALVSEETTVPGAPNCPMFPADNIWNTDISKLPVDSHSAAWLRGMDLRYERLLYFRRLSRKLGDGILYHDPWHHWASYSKQREDRYKNIDRTTIRRPPCYPERVEPNPKTYPVVVHRAGKSWNAYVPDLEGVYAAADSRERVIELITEAIPFHLRQLTASEASKP